MTSNRWQTVKELAAVASELEGEARHAYLAHECGEDAGLRAEVHSLLAAAESAPTLVDRPAIDSLKPELGADAERGLIGRQLGAYQIVRPIAFGGMGSVYLARRADDAYRNEVAIKLIRGSLLDGESYHRFCQERQTLADLNHPNIARLLDGGRSDDGLPYLVMEYVAGQPIDAYCNERQLDLPARLRLFRDVCAAVQYAHQNLVVHRDLKPSNILVNADGVVKLLDFGIAKVLNAGELHTARAVTTMQGCLTPDYASPEQIRGQAITTSSDVYSLGVLLYELLTGRLPFESERKSLHDLARTICEIEPERPSTVARRTPPRTRADAGVAAADPESAAATRDGRPEKLWRRLAGDLDAILLMALRKEPQRRYASVEQLSDDVRRHLEGLPVRARQGTWRYHSVKFARRNWPAVTAAAVMTASLIGGIVVSVRSAAVASRERDAAQQARQLARQEAENARVEAKKAARITVFLQDMISAANPAEEGPDVPVGRLLDEAAARVASEFADDAEVESAVRTAIGETYKGLGRYDDAERHLRGALELQYRIHGDEHADVAKSLNTLGVLLHAKGRYADAQDCLERALAIHRKLEGGDQSEVAQVLNNLAVVLRVQGQETQAEPMLRDALQIRRRLLGDEHLETVQSLNNLANLLQSRGDFAAAEPLCREVLVVRRKLLGAEHPDVTQAINNLAVVLAMQGLFAEAEPLLRDSLALYRKRLGSDHPETAGCLFNLASLLRRADDPGGAEPLLRECLEIRTRRLPAGDLRTAFARQELAICLVALGRFAEAASEMVEVHAALEATLGTEHARTVGALRSLVSLLETLQRPDEAACYRERLPLTTAASVPATP
ncbi:MAG: serine/threonine-protein kinase [Phycisphaerae bacterium]